MDSDAEFAAGYRDGRDKSAPWPSGNRSHCYRHSFDIGRAELAGNPIPTPIALERAAEAEKRDTPKETHHD